MYMINNTSPFLSFGIEIPAARVVMILEILFFKDGACTMIQHSSLPNRKLHPTHIEVGLQPS